MTPKIYKKKKVVHREKMAGLDYDWTLVSPKGWKSYPSNLEDWEWLYPSISEKRVTMKTGIW